jgi:uncharacterized protein (TIGR04141 family)
MKDKKIQGLTIYLIKPSLTQDVEIIKHDPAIRQCSIPLDEERTYHVFSREVPSKFPKWTDFFVGHVEREFFGKIKSAAAILLIPVDDRFFAIAFGQGRFLLAEDCYEESFGLKVVLNSIGEDHIRSIDKETFNAIPKQSREQVSRDASAYDFGLDVERDLLRGVTGVPADKEALGKLLSGTDSLKAHLPVSLEGLEEPLRRYLRKAQDDTYKKNFPWVDHISSVKNKDTIGLLDLFLLDRLLGRDLDRCWLAAPDIVDWSSVRGFRYSEVGHEYHDIHLETFLATLSGPVTREILSRRRVFCMGDDDYLKDHWPVYRCLYCEMDYGSDSFLLSGGKWYQVARSFVDEVNASFREIPQVELGFPDYDDDSENLYLKRIAAGQDHYALMDSKNILHGPLGSKVEFCDLFGQNNDVIHAKKYGGSSVLSHLFAQGSVSGELMLTDPEFRKKVRSILPATHLTKVPVERPSPDEYRIIFAVISTSDRPLSLPFFSRLSLRHAARRLSGFGYKVVLAKIGVAESRKKIHKKGTKPRKHLRRS